MKKEEEYSKLKFINADIPQGSILGLVYFLDTCDILKTKEITIATFAYDTALIEINKEIT